VLNPIPSQLNPVHGLLQYSCNINIRLSVPLWRCIPRYLLYSVFQAKSLYTIVVSSVRLTRDFHLALLSLTATTLEPSSGRYTFWSFPWRRRDLNFSAICGGILGLTACILEHGKQLYIKICCLHLQGRKFLLTNSMDQGLSWEGSRPSDRQ